MEALLSAVLLSSLLQLCSAAAVLEPLTCSDFNNRTASDLAVHHINEHHRHGYKFQMAQLSGAALEKVEGGCRVQLQLLLRETTCPTVDPREFHECSVRTLGERAVVANCNVVMTVMDNNATVTSYNCKTQEELSREVMIRCPDCPTLMPLSDATGLKSIYEALTEFNQNTSNERVYVLKEVGRIKLGFMLTAGTVYYSEFLLVETVCPRASKIVHGACRPLCPDRARHAFCSISYSVTNGLYRPLQCKIYPAKNTAALGPGEEEPICVSPRPYGPPGTPPHAHGHPPPGPLPDAHGHPPHAHGPPPHAHGTPPHAHGTPPHAHGPPPHAHGPPPHANGPPPHAHGTPPHANGPPPHAHGTPPSQGKQQHHLLIASSPPPKPRHCMGMKDEADLRLHPICPWPVPALPDPRGG